MIEQIEDLGEDQRALLRVDRCFIEDAGFLQHCSFLNIVEGVSTTC